MFLSHARVKYFVLGGGRIISPVDQLFRFKRKNSSSEVNFYTGKRVLNETVYNEIKKKWSSVENNSINESLTVLQEKSMNFVCKNLNLKI